VNISILSVRTGWHTDELLRALSERGHVGVVVPYEGLVARMGVRGGGPSGPPADPQLRSDGIPLFEADAVLARIIPSGSLEQIIYRVDALHWIEERGVPVINSPRAIERAVDKFYTSALMQEAGLPTVETVVCEHAADAMAAVREFGDAVIKPIFGSMGHGIVRVSDPDVAFRVVKTLETTRAVFYVQRAIDHGERDYRLFVIGGRVLAAIERRAADGDWRSNVARGAAAAAFEAPAAWQDLAVRAAGAIGADYAGVDLLQGRDGRVYVLEVNGIPGWEGLQRATGVDVAGAIVEHVEARVPPSPSGSPCEPPKQRWSVGPRSGPTRRAGLGPRLA
jgi:RimK family alpha-L-glutamate ligase